jgi:integrase
LTADRTLDELRRPEERGAGPGDVASAAGALIVRTPPPLGLDAAAVSTWFDAMVEAEAPVLDGTLAAERDAAEAYARMAKAENTRRAYRAAVRAWCAWCTRRNRPPLPGAGADVAAFLASERGRGLTPETLKLRRAAIRHLHRAAGCAVPTDDVAVSETLAGICRQAARQGVAPRKKVAATAGILRQILAPIPADLRGLRDRALLLVGFAGALRRSELAAIRVEQLEKTERGLRLTLPQSKGSPTDAVTVPLPYGHTELCPVRALTAWLEAAGITSGPAFRRIWLPKKFRPGGGRQGSVSEAGGSPTGGEPPPLPPQAVQRPTPPQPSPAPPRLGSQPITPWAVAQIVKARATEAGFRGRDFGGHSLKRGALTTGMDRGEHPAKLKRLGRHKSLDVLGEYLEFGDLFEGHPLNGVL